ncbi:MAG: hypothetical protein NVSMB32_01060 [Actinomycetota bacterium]
MQPASARSDTTLTQSRVPPGPQPCEGLASGPDRRASGHRATGLVGVPADFNPWHPTVGAIAGPGGGFMAPGTPVTPSRYAFRYRHHSEPSGCR